MILISIYVHRVSQKIGKGNIWLNSIKIGKYSYTRAVQEYDLLLVDR